MKDIYKYIDDNVDEYIKDLQEFIRKPSVSAQKLGLEECANYVVEKMHKDGLPAALHEIPDGPPLVFGHLKSSNSKKTMFCYVLYIPKKQFLSKTIYVLTLFLKNKNINLIFFMFFQGFPKCL